MGQRWRTDNLEEIRTPKTFLLFSEILLGFPSHLWCWRGRLEILLENENRWGLLEQKLMEMREVNRRESTAQVGLSATESPFYNILELRSEVSQVKTHWIIQPNRR